MRSPVWLGMRALVAVVGLSHSVPATGQDCGTCPFPWPSGCERICQQRLLRLVDERIEEATEESPFFGRPANVVADETLYLLEERRLPRTNADWPMPSGLFYTGFADRGWTELSNTGNASEKIGSIVVWQTMMGVVVAEDDAGGLRVLYPSASNKGELRIGSVEALGGREPPRFVVPE